uniref:Uncharacterized protein n=1 Tax=Rhizophora mucronata TaxID=61149 RepID=A0A2P2IPQ4_RHIMU
MSIFKGSLEVGYAEKRKEMLIKNLLLECEKFSWAREMVAGQSLGFNNF